MEQRKKNPYAANATMKMLGRNSAAVICKPIEDQINDVISARPYGSRPARYSHDGQCKEKPAETA